MTVTFINQENKEIAKADWRIDSYKIWGKLMAAEFPSVILILRVNWKSLLIPLKNTFELKY